MYFQETPPQIIKDTWMRVIEYSPNQKIAFCDYQTVLMEML